MQSTRTHPRIEQSHSERDRRHLAPAVLAVRQMIHPRTDGSLKADLRAMKVEPTGPVDSEGDLISLEEAERI